ncbi:hypothetical protein MMC31_008137 [Peltigera leucophlebia]|nr:hypothetical protein [Peltigera leucophlebia]
MAQNLTFLTLVPEIRDQIYEIVLSSSIAPPKSPSASGPRTRLDSLGFRGVLESTTYFPLQPFPWAGAALVRTCHQVCTEVSALARVVENRNRAQKKVNYELDIMINEEMTLYPTWVNLLSVSPTEQRPVDQIWANLRTIGQFDPSTRRGGRSGWRDANAWPPSLVWGLFNMLNRFFAYGHSFQQTCLKNQAGHPGKIHMAIGVPRLEELVLNVVTPTEEEMEGRKYVDIQDWESVGVLRPEKLVNFLQGFIEDLQNPARHGGKYAGRYGLFEKLGKIRLFLDEKEVGSWGFSSHIGCEQGLDPAPAI